MVWPDRSASSGVAWDCLRSQMRTGTIFSFVKSSSSKAGDGYAASLTQTGQVICDGSRAGIFLSAITFLWVSLLVILHILLSVVLTSVGAIWIRQAKWVDEDHKKLVNSPNLMLAAMPVLAVGAAAEVAQHVFDNWLYLGLIPTFYLATFYSGLAMGQSLLALGAWDGDPGCWMQILPIASVLSFVIIAGSGVSCTNAARGAENEISGDPDLAYGDCIQFLPFIPAFITLGLATVFIFIKSKAPTSMQHKFLCIALTSLVIGIGSSLVLTKTGWQWLHVPTAGGFFGLFLSELVFVKKIPGANGVVTADEIIPGEHTQLIV
eukprot:scaffold157200_cov56-Attheya_sp.AAC.3